MQSALPANHHHTPDLELQSSVRQLSLDDKGPSIRNVHRPNVNTNVKKTKPPVVADSWEDEDSESESGPPTPTARDTKQNDDDDGSTLVQGPEGPEEEDGEDEGTLDPPPTPISPQTAEYQNAHHQQQPGATAGGGGGGVSIRAYGNPNSSSSSSSRNPPSRRPEKQTAVAGRMIAGALGVRAPKKTEEQRAYDRAVKEQEIKRRNREKEEAARAREEEEKAKAAVWDA